MDVLKKIKKLQEEKGLNKTQLAKIANLSPNTIHSLYKRNNQPTIYTLEALCKAFGITLSQFFADSNIPLSLTPEQTCLLEYWNGMSDKYKEAVMNFIKGIV